jgi:ABC-2 type transport system ATP-binding protein
MSELEGVVDHLVVVGRGRVVADTGVRELLAGVAAGRVTLRTAAPAAAAAALGRSAAAVLTTGPDTLTVTGLPGAAIVARPTEAGIPFSELAAHRAGLADAYVQLTGDAVQYRGAEVER